MFRPTCLLIALCGIPLACNGADAPAAAGSADQELTELIALYVGTYLSPADEGARESRPIHLRVLAVKPPPGRARALYSEMRHDGPDGELYRQSLLVFDETPGRAGNTMTSLSFSDRQAATALVDDPGLVAAGRLETRVALGTGCTMHFRREGEGFLGRIDPATCVITGKRGDTRHIEAQTFLRRDAIEQLERGYGADGQLLFGNPEGIRYVWPRIDAADVRR